MVGWKSNEWARLHIFLHCIALGYYSRATEEKRTSRVAILPSADMMGMLDVEALRLNGGQGVGK